MNFYRMFKAFCFLGTIGLLFLPFTNRTLLSVAAETERSVNCSENIEKREEAYRANNRGVALLEQFSPPEAVKEFRRALSICPDIVHARVNLSIALFNA